MSEMIKQLEDDRRRMQREVLMRRVLHTLRDTIQVRGLTPETPVPLPSAGSGTAPPMRVSMSDRAVDRRILKGR